MRNILKIVLCSLLFSLCIISVKAETMDDHVYAYNDETELLVKDFEVLGIDSEISEELARKVLNGEQLDCEKDQFLSIAPIEHIQMPGFFKEVYEYPDGSRRVISVTAGSASITGGSYSSGTYWYSWTNAVVSYSDGLVSIQFNASMGGSPYDAHLYSVSGLSYSSNITTSSFGINIANAKGTGSVAYGGFTGAKFGTGNNISLLVYVPVGGSPYAVAS